MKRSAPSCAAALVVALASCSGQIGGSATGPGAGSGGGATVHGDHPKVMRLLGAAAGNEPVSTTLSGITV